MDETVKIGSKVGFMFCGTVDANTESTIDKLSDIQLARLKRLCAEYQKDNARFEGTWETKHKNMKRFMAGVALKERWKKEKREERYKEAEATFKAERLKARIALDERIAEASERIRTWTNLNERKVKEEYESIEGGTIIIIEGKESGDYWDVAEYEGRTTTHEPIKSLAGMEQLAAATMKQACADIGKGRHGKDAETFLRSEWAKQMCPRVDGDAIIKQVKANIKDHGKWMAKEGEDDD